MMVASILRGPRATRISIELLRAFARSRAGQIVTAYGLGEILDEIRRAHETKDDLDTAREVTYFIQAGENGPIKIGVTGNFEKRFRGLEMMSPVALRILGVVPVDIEAECHAALANWRLHGEWFEPAPAVIAFIQQALPTKQRVN